MQMSQETLCIQAFKALDSKTGNGEESTADTLSQLPPLRYALNLLLHENFFRGMECTGFDGSGFQASRMLSPISSQSAGFADNHAGFVPSKSK